MRIAISSLGSLGLALALAGCTNTSLKHQGETCFASSECESGLVCDLGGSGTCTTQGSGGSPDAGANQPDGAPGQPDAAPGSPDATPATPDAAVATPDAAVPLPDAGP